MKVLDLLLSHCYDNFLHFQSTGSVLTGENV